MTAVAVSFEWRHVGDVTFDRDGKLAFSSDLVVAPDRYRLRLAAGNSLAVYAGEAVDLRRRGYHYRRPGPTQRTSILTMDGRSRHLRLATR